MAENLKERMRADLNTARRNRDRDGTVLLSMTLSEVRNREIEVGRELSDDEVVQVVASAIKRRREAAEQMRAGARPELAEKEEREIDLLAPYLPPPLSEAAVRELVRQAITAGASDVGAVMRRIVPEIKGRFEGREANRIVREELE